MLPLRTCGGAIGIVAIDERIVDVNLDPIERDDGLDRAAGAAFFEGEDTQHVELLQLRVDIGHVAIDEAGRLAHTLGCLCRDRSNERKTEWGETVDEVAVGSELECRVSIRAIEIVGVDVLDELERVLAELFSVADGDVERGHGRGIGESGGVRSVWAGWVAADGLPVLVRARPELDESVFHPLKLDVVSIADSGVVLVALRILVRVVVPDEREIIEGTYVERVLPT